MKKVIFEEIRHLIPENGSYYLEMFRSPILYAEGDQVWDQPMDLDEIYGVDETEDFYPFILVNGNLTANQIFNEETDGSTGLVVLGNLQADNIVVGGQCIYITGNLSVDGLYWGDYNHGELIVEGIIQAKAFINTDYGVDYQRFRAQERMTIGHFLWDEMDNDYEDRTRIAAFLKPEFLIQEDALLEDELYSWKEWIDEVELFAALRSNGQLLLDSPAPAVSTPAYPFLFDNEEINEKNLSALMDKRFFAFREAVRGEENLFEYWQYDVFKRISFVEGKPLSVSAYFQYDEDYACMVFFGYEPTLMSRISGKKDYKLSVSYRRNLADDGEEWLKLDARAPQPYRDFVTTQWKNLLREISEMAYLQEQYESLVTLETFNSIMALPVVRHLGTQYYNDDDGALFFRGVEWQFRNKDADDEEKAARITIAKSKGYDDEGEALYEFYHFQLEKDEHGKEQILLYTQDENDYSSGIYELPISERTKFQAALRHFQLLAEHIHTKNTAYTNSKNTWPPSASNSNRRGDGNL